ncbi:unnamed protein product [Amoebophrya sp. A25]|nr:unnamed protein product [Amoebophrya sp. A25]|eukprot:GSA25T00009744001.1
MEIIEDDKAPPASQCSGAAVKTHTKVGVVGSRDSAHFLLGAGAPFVRVATRPRNSVGSSKRYRPADKKPRTGPRGSELGLGPFPSDLSGGGANRDKELTGQANAPGEQGDVSSAPVAAQQAPSSVSVSKAVIHNNRGQSTSTRKHVFQFPVITAADVVRAQAAQNKRQLGTEYPEDEVFPPRDDNNEENMRSWDAALAKYTRFSTAAPAPSARVPAAGQQELTRGDETTGRKIAAEHRGSAEDPQTNLNMATLEVDHEHEEDHGALHVVQHEETAVMTTGSWLSAAGGPADENGANVIQRAAKPQIGDASSTTRAHSGETASRTLSGEKTSRRNSDPTMVPEDAASSVASSNLGEQYMSTLHDFQPPGAPAKRKAQAAVISSRRSKDVAPGGGGVPNGEEPGALLRLASKSSPAVFAEQSPKQHSSNTDRRLGDSAHNGLGEEDAEEPDHMELLPPLPEDAGSSARDANHAIADPRATFVSEAALHLGEACAGCSIYPHADGRGSDVKQASAMMSMREAATISTSSFEEMMGLPGYTPSDAVNDHSTSTCHRLCDDEDLRLLQGLGTGEYVSVEEERRSSTIGLRLGMGADDEDTGLALPSNTFYRPAAHLSNNNGVLVRSTSLVCNGVSPADVVGTTLLEQPLDHDRTRSGRLSGTTYASAEVFGNDPVRAGLTPPQTPANMISPFFGASGHRSLQLMSSGHRGAEQQHAGLEFGRSMRRIPGNAASGRRIILVTPTTPSAPNAFGDAGTQQRQGGAACERIDEDVVAGVPGAVSRGTSFSCALNPADGLPPRPMFGLGSALDEKSSSVGSNSAFVEQLPANGAQRFDMYFQNSAEISGEEHGGGHADEQQKGEQLIGAVQQAANCGSIGGACAANSSRPAHRVFDTPPDSHQRRSSQSCLFRPSSRVSSGELARSANGGQVNVILAGGHHDVSFGAGGAESVVGGRSVASSCGGPPSSSIESSVELPSCDGANVITSPVRSMLACAERAQERSSHRGFAAGDGLHRSSSTGGVAQQGHYSMVSSTTGGNAGQPEEDCDRGFVPAPPAFRVFGSSSGEGRVQYSRRSAALPLSADRRCRRSFLSADRRSAEKQSDGSYGEQEDRNVFDIFEDHPPQEDAWSEHLSDDEEERVQRAARRTPTAAHRNAARSRNPTHHVDKHTRGSGDRCQPDHVVAVTDEFGRMIDHGKTHNGEDDFANMRSAGRAAETPQQKKKELRRYEKDGEMRKPRKQPTILSMLELNPDQILRGYSQPQPGMRLPTQNTSCASSSRSHARHQRRPEPRLYDNWPINASNRH